jgi:hypothetical protein
MKRIVILAMAMVLAAGSVFAADFRIGIFGGGFFQMDFSSMKPKKGGGAFLNFDFTYAELGVAFVGESSGVGDVSKVSNSISSNTITGAGKDFVNGLSATGMSIILNGKFPFTLGNLSVFPLAGVRYDIMFQQKLNGGGEITDAALGEISKILGSGDLSAIDFNNMYINLGGGLDFAITDHFFFREEVVWAFKIPNKYDLAYAAFAGQNVVVEFFSSSSPTIMLSVGFKF